MKKLFQALSLGLVVLFMSCSQDKDEEVAPTTTTTIAVQGVKVNLSIDAEIDEESLRNLNGKFSKDDNWRPVITKPQKGQTIPLSLVFSDGTNVSYHNDLNFKVVNDEGKLSFSGEINVKNYSTTKAWYVTAIYGGAKGNNKYGYAPQMYELGEGEQEFKIGTDTGGLNIPYMSGWTRVKTALNATNGTISVFSVKLRPQGYLLRLKVKNKRDHKLFVQRFMSANSDVFFNADFSLKTTLSDLQNGAYPVASLRPNPNGTEGNGRFINGGAGVDLDRGDTTPTETKAYLVWVMPSNKLTENKEFTLNVIHYKQGAEWIFPFKITLQPGADGVGGISSLKTLSIPNDHKPYRTIYDIDFVAKGNMKSDGTEAAEGEVGYSNTWAHYNSNIRKNANIRKHGTDMTPTNWLALLPRSGTQQGVYYDGGGYTDGWEFFSSDTGSSALTGTVGGNFQLYDNGPKTNYTRAAIGTARILYAVREMPTSQFQGKKGAFRYQLDQNGNLLIEMVHLQSNLGITKAINEVNNEAYWATARQYGEVVKRLFPGGTGIELPRNEGGKQINSISYYYVGVLNDAPAGTLWNYGKVGGAGRIGISLAIGNDQALPGTKALRKVRLMKEEIQSLHVNPK